MSPLLLLQRRDCEDRFASRRRNEAQALPLLLAYSPPFLPSPPYFRLSPLPTLPYPFLVLCSVRVIIMIIIIIIVDDNIIIIIIIIIIMIMIVISA